MQNSLIIDRLNYINNNISYYIGNIYEYDIHNAYPNILKDTAFIFSDETLKDYIISATNGTKKYEKKEILIRIGKEIGNNGEIGVYINNILKDVIKEFQIKNNITETDIFSIKKDALFVKKHCEYRNIRGLDFQIKNKYNLYFYDFISKHEYYIYKNKNNIEYSVKGLGKVYDKNVYKNLSNIIYKSFNQNSLDLVKSIQNKFLNQEYNNESLYDYIPEMLLYKEFVYIPKDDYLALENITREQLKEIYFKYYHNVFKSLINYIL